MATTSTKEATAFMVVYKQHGSYTAFMMALTLTASSIIFISLSSQQEILLVVLVTTYHGEDHCYHGS